MDERFRWAVALTIGGGAAAWSPGMDETRRQVQSLTINNVFNIDGTGIIIGQIEPGVPLPHANVPYIARNPDVPVAANDPSLHALEVAGIMISNHAQFSGMAPGAALYCDRPGNNMVPAGSGDALGGAENNFLDAINYMATAGTTARVVNASFGFTTLPAAGGLTAHGLSKASLGVDWYVSQPRAGQGDFLFVKSAANFGIQPVTVPGDTYNGMTIGAVTNQDYQDGTTYAQGPVNRRWNVLANFSDWGTATSLAKPDLVAPGARTDTDDAATAAAQMEVGFTMATGAPLAANGFAANPRNATTGMGRAFVGTSYAAPHVAGVAAQLYSQAPNTSHLAMKAVLMNGADKTVRGVQHRVTGNVFYRVADPQWTAGPFGLDAQTGAGMLNAWDAAANLLPGDTSATGGRIGVRSGTLDNGSGDVNVVTVPVGVDTKIVATVTWDRVVNRAGAAGAAQNNVTYSLAGNQPHFALKYSSPTSSVTQNSAGGSVQHINAVVSDPGNYQFKINNNGTGANTGTYSVAWAVSPPDVDPGERDIWFTVRDQIHQPRAERTNPETPHVNDRILEGRTGTAVRVAANNDAVGFNDAVEAQVYQTRATGTNTTFRSAPALGTTFSTASVDDHVNDISFGRDNIVDLRLNGGRIFFSVDGFAQGLSPNVGNHPISGVYSEATIVHEAAGDVFQSNLLKLGAAPQQNANIKLKNTPNDDSFHPDNNVLSNSTYGDSYFLGLVGGRVSDREDDVTGLEGLATQNKYTTLSVLAGDFVFFTLDRGSPSTLGPGATKKTGEIYVSRAGTDGAVVYATAAQLGLNDTDCIDGLMIQHYSALNPAGYPVYNPAQDTVVFSVDRDSTGAPGTFVRTESTQGESAGDLFVGTPNFNSLFLEATDLGLQEFAPGGGANWLSDNLDALDISDSFPARFSQWTKDADDVWSNAANWQGGVPNSNVAVAEFRPGMTGPRQVTNDAAHTVQAISFTSAQPFTLVGNNPLTIQSSAASIPCYIESSFELHSINVPLIILRDTQITVNGSSPLTFLRDTTATGVRLDKLGTGPLRIFRVNAGEMRILEGKVDLLTVPNMPAVRLKVGSLRFARNGAAYLGTLDIFREGVVVDYTGDSPAQSIADAIKSGRRPQADWSGTGLTSITAAFDPMRLSVGFAESSTVGSMFMGEPVDDTSLLIRNTIIGDANLDTFVNISDFARLAFKFNEPGFWWQGDFNYDFVVDIGDFSLLASRFNQSLGNPGFPPGSAGVPEPASGVALGMILLRRRRQTEPLA